jgi:hypothetical protein
MTSRKQIGEVVDALIFEAQVKNAYSVLQFEVEMSPMSPKLTRAHIIVVLDRSSHGRKIIYCIHTRYGLDVPGFETRWGKETLRTRPDRP